MSTVDSRPNESPKSLLSSSERNEAIAGATNDFYLSESRAIIHAGNNTKNSAVGNVLAKIVEAEASLEQTYVHTSELRAIANGLDIGGKTLGFKDAGLARFSKCLGMPVEYTAKIRPELRSSIQNSHLLHEEFADAKMSGGMVRILSRSGEFLGMDRGDLGFLTGQTVFQAVVDGIGQSNEFLRIENFKIECETLALDFVSERVGREVRKGDVLFGGLHVEHSLLGENATKIEPFLFRLRCSNGAVVRECLGARQGHRTRRLAGSDLYAREQQIDQVRRLAREGFGKLAAKLSAVQQLTERTLNHQADVVKVLGEFLRRARMHSANVVSLLQHAWEHPLGGNREMTYFGVLNALTWLATHHQNVVHGEQTISDRQAGILLRLAGVFANQSVHICPSCFRVSGAT